MLNCLKIDITLAALVRVFGHIVLIKIIQFSIGKLESREYWLEMKLLIISMV